jgi:hypothetical protein
MVENWTEIIVGIIMIISPWVLGFSDISLAKWCNVLIGLLLVLMGARGMFGEQAPAVPASQESKKERTHKYNVEK